ncbi:MAG: DNA mismatch repair endonuclease MutL, partial [Verrucomicrobiales bacterium]|nr:DNA mismatch repair endonuclease MutL [Verrucomicrobiales bacterium]
MNRIRLLPEQVANQIAAGEVIERPASVVKELVENALDAQATRLTVEIQSGGRTLIRVTDDGIGMSRDDALLSLERHATSKIRCAEDLAAIGTLGFRGEALPSIASVSRFTLTTRERGGESPEATQIVVHGGKIIEVRAAGAPPGTCVEVRQLFFNLPARRKFLRSEETEAAHIQHYLTLAALAFPEVAFTFRRDGRTIWQLPALEVGGDGQARLAALRERLRALYGAELQWLAVDYTAALPTDAEPEEGASFEAAEATPPTQTGSTLRVWGFIGAPGVSRATREDQHLFVNRRPVENRALNFALLEGYHTALMKGRYPVCCLFLELDPSAVDVNVHPAKREVKFHRENDVRRCVAQAVRETLLRFHAGKVTAAPARTHDLNRTAARSAPDESASVTPTLTGLAGLTPPAAPPARRAEQPALKMGFAPSPAATSSPPAVTPHARVAAPPAVAPPTGPATAPASAAT